MAFPPHDSSSVVYLFLNPLDLLNAYMVLPPKVKVCDSSHFESKNSCEKKQEPLQKRVTVRNSWIFQLGPRTGTRNAQLGHGKTICVKHTQEKWGVTFSFLFASILQQI